MRMRRKVWATPELAASPFFIRDGAALRGRWRQRFAAPALPLCAELGCGKGGFISTLAAADSACNYIAVDMIDNMLGYTSRAVAQSYRQAARETDNILLVSQDCARISGIFCEEDALERLYINFCNPWPKRQHQKRRLTHTRQLLQYRAFLAPRGEIHFKTDDGPLFEDTLCYLKEAGFEPLTVSRDLHQSKIVGNILTEHERFFSQSGVPIKFCRAIKNP